MSYTERIKQDGLEILIQEGEYDSVDIIET